MADPQQDSLFREIDEDLRRDRLLKLWKQYGNAVIAAAVLLVVGVAGFQLWHGYQLGRREAAGEQFAAARELARSGADAADAFRALAGTAPGGYVFLARLREAAALAERGDHAAAAAIYRSLQADAPDQTYRDLSVLLRVQTLMSDPKAAADGAELRAALAPLAVDGNPWRFSARELLALLDLQAGQTAEARQQLALLAADPSAPAALKERAEQILAQIGKG
jgi:hypothetical protein